jgi:hypothetical protein
MENNNPTGAKLDVLRDILFGEKVEQYNGELSEIRKYISKVQSDLEEKINHSNRQLFAALQAVNDDLTAELNRTKAHTKAEFERVDNEKTNRVELGKMMIMMGQQLIEDGKAREVIN